MLRLAVGVADRSQRKEQGEKQTQHFRDAVNETGLSPRNAMPVEMPSMTAAPGFYTKQMENSSKFPAHLITGGNGY